jgi:hypothetical protein
MTGDNLTEIEARNALIDAVIAFGEHSDSLILVGAQALYFRTSKMVMPVAPATKDADFTINPRTLKANPLLEKMLEEAGFRRDLISNNPGAWVSGQNIPVDFMVPGLLAGAGSRSAYLSPHANYIGRKTDGLEASIFDYSREEVHSLDGSRTAVNVNIANEPSLLIAKLVKVGERIHNPKRFQQKDCYDIYRLLSATIPELIVPTFARLSREDLVERSLQFARETLEEHFAMSSDSIGSFSAGQAEFRIGDPDAVAARTMAMSRELLSLWNDRY